MRQLQLRKLRLEVSRCSRLWLFSLCLLQQGPAFSSSASALEPAAAPSIKTQAETKAAQGGEQATVAVASNFAPVIKALVDAFEASSDHKLVVATASSGKLYAQIRHGAPFHLFFSADQDKPKALADAGLTDPQGPTTYAIGQLALWSPRPGQAQHLKKQLLLGEYQRLAFANPKHAPYGRAALQTLRALGVEVSSEQHKWVRGENIAQAFQFVMTGNAEIGFVALSQISQNGHISRGSAWLVPAALHQPIHQDVVLLRQGQTNRAAIEFLEFVRSKPGQGIIASYGYRTPDQKPATTG